MLKKSNHLDENTSQVEIRNNILDNLAVPIYVSDLATNEVLYANIALKLLYGDTQLVGRICWEVLRSESKRCKMCPISQLFKNPGESYHWEMNAEGRHFQISDCIIPWIGGKLVHLQYMVEILK